MDPLGLIVAALAAGATAGVRGTAGEAVKDAYNSLKELLKSKLSSKPEGEMILSKYEAKPSVWKAPLKDALTEVAAERDNEIVKSAERLMSLVNPQQVGMGKYNVQITGNVEGFVQGDNARVTMKFGDKPAPKGKK